MATFSCMGGRGERRGSLCATGMASATGLCPFLVACFGLSNELLPPFSSLDATRGMGGSCGGYGDTGEADA